MAKKQKENRLVVGDASWAADTPEWVLEEVATERMMLGFAVLANKDLPIEDRVGDAELVAYLMPASMRAPLGHTTTQIYLYVTTRLMERRGTPIPADVRVETLRPDEERELRDLKHTLYRLRGGEIVHPVLDALRQLKKECGRKGKKPPTRKLPKQTTKHTTGTLFDM